MPFPYCTLERLGLLDGGLMAAVQAVEVLGEQELEENAALTDAMEAQDAAHGTCAYYPADSSGCRAPRSCFHCLHRVLDMEPSGCLLDERGRCVSVLEPHNASLDSRASGEPGDVHGSTSSAPAASRQFLASNASYCAAKGECDACLGSSASCVGRDGCVCVAACEASDWATAVGGSDCGHADKTPWNDPMVISPFRSETVVQDDDDANTQVFWSTAVILLATLAATLAMVLAIRRRGGNHGGELENDVRSVLGTPTSVSNDASRSSRSFKTGDRQLNLFGWEAMCADLIAKERREMLAHGVFMAAPASPSSEEDSTSTSTSTSLTAVLELPNASPASPYVQLLGAQPSAPELSPRSHESSAPRLSMSYSAGPSRLGHDM